MRNEGSRLSRKHYPKKSEDETRAHEITYLEHSADGETFGPGKPNGDGQEQGAFFATFPVFVKGFVDQIASLMCSEWHGC